MRLTGAPTFRTPFPIRVVRVYPGVRISPDQRLQFPRKRDSRTLALRRTTGPIQGVRRIRKQMVSSSTISLLVGTRDPPKAYGLFPILYGDENPSASPV